MKKMTLMLLVFIGATAAANAQTEVKAKPTTTPVQAVHNTFHKHKHHSGYKVKAQNGDHKSVTKVNKDGDVRTKND